MVEGTRRAQALAALLTGTGIAHFVVPKFYDPMIPPQLPGTARSWVYGSGVAEAAVAAVIAVPRTRRLGGALAAVLFVGIFPANLQMTADAFRNDRPWYEKLVLIFRLPAQVPLIRWALRVRNTASA